MPLLTPQLRSVQDYQWTAAALALPAAASTTVTQGVVPQSGAAYFDLTETGAYKVEEIDVVAVLPALSATIVPDTRLVTIEVQTCAATNFTTIVHTLNKVLVGAGGVGVAAQEIHFRLPPDAPRYCRMRVTFGASTTDGSALTYVASIRF